MEKTHDYISKSGRKSKQLFENYNFMSKSKNKHNMPILQDEASASRETMRKQELDAERQELARQRRELEEMKQRLEARLNAQPTQRHEQRTNGMEEIQTIVSNFSNFQIEVQMPKFGDESEKNPMAFLEEIEKFFKVKNIKEERKMEIIEHALTGRASLWFETQNSDNYEIFKAKFIDEFYSIPIRVRFKNAWNERRYDQKSPLHHYYYSQIKESRYFRPNLTKYEINYAIVQQYPMWIRENLTTIDYNNDATIGQALASLENIRLEKEKFRENKNQYNYSRQREQNHTIKQMRSQYSGDFEKARNPGQENNNHQKYNNRRKYYSRPPRNTYSNTASNERIQLPDTRFPPPTNVPSTPRTIPTDENQNNNGNSALN